MTLACGQNRWVRLKKCSSMGE